MALRWGIASTGKISHDFVNATLSLPPTDHQIVAVAARSKETAENFAKQYNIPKTHEGYQALAQDSNVQVVYVSVINPLHYQVAKLMLENGKHVLCEKPFTMNEKQTRKLVQLAKEKQLFLMEAIWSRCFPVYKEIKKIIQSGKIGEVKHVTAELGFEFPLKPKEIGGGALLDLGIYVLQLQQLIFRGLKPTKVTASGHLNSFGTDSSFSAIFTYPGGKTAVVSSSEVLKLSNKAFVFGSKGAIEIPECWAPSKLVVSGEVQEYPLPVSGATFNYDNSAGLAYEAEEVRKCILGGKTESSEMPLEETIQLAQWMDEIRRQVGVVYESDAEQ